MLSATNSKGPEHLANSAAQPVASNADARRLAVRLTAGLLVGISVLLSTFAVAVAQTGRSDQFRLENIDPSLIERFRQRQAGPTGTSQDVTSPLDTVRPDDVPPPDRAPESVSEEPSPLERDYADRLLRQAPEFAHQRAQRDDSQPALEQFGYRMLSSLSVAGNLVGTGAINDSYQLGIGDELVITFRGQTNRSYRTAVDREGQVVLPDMPPVPAAGRSFGHFRAVLEQVAAATFLKTEVFVSLGNVRNFPVMVLGQVNRPGVHRVTGVASVLDAIVAAGGVQKTGSLRQVRLIRGSEAVPVDFYDLLLTGQLVDDITLMEGDRVFVPPIGPTMAVAGDVQRPGIYELAGPQSYLTAFQAIGLAGGTLRPQGYRYLRISTEQEGGDFVSEITDPRQSPARFSDIVLVSKLGYSWDGAFILDGHVTVPGPRALRLDRTVGSIINEPDILRQNPYLLFAAIETSDPKTKARHFLPVDLGRIVSGKSDVPLRPEDRLIIFGSEDIRFLSSRSVQAVLEARNEGRAIIRPDLIAAAQAGPQGQAVQGQVDDMEPLVCRGLQSLAAVVSRSRSERFSNARLAVNPDKQQVIPSGESCSVVFDRYPDLLPFVLDFVVAVNGEVRVPGIYPIAPGTTIGGLVPIVGGLSPEADLAQIELSRFASLKPQDGAPFERRTIDASSTSLLKVALTPGDIIRFNPKFSERDTGSILLSGEFKRPGVYTIRRGERLSEVIARAGGLTEQAYPLGAVFTRESARQREAKAFERAAVDLESGLAETLASGALADQQASPEALVLAVQGLANQLRTTEAIGRVVVEADPTVLDVRREFDNVLEPGDRLHMPKRPNSVTVSGEVLNPGTIQFVSGKTVDEYVDNAGGVTRVSDDGRIFVIFPNGEAQTVTISSWNFTSVRIPPGSTIVVPRDPKPFDLLAFSISLSEILSRLAITAASLVVIGNN
jgi:protein involved in polysaccharide export with SLBB domain